MWTKRAKFRFAFIAKVCSTLFVNGDLLHRLANVIVAAGKKLEELLVGHTRTSFQTSDTSSIVDIKIFTFWRSLTIFVSLGTSIGKLPSFCSKKVLLKLRNCS